MMHQIKHSKKINFVEHWILITSFFVVLVILFSSVFSSGRSFVFKTISPFFKLGGVFYEDFGRIPSLFNDKERLIEENSMLTKALEMSKNTTLDYQSLKSENEKLRQELKMKPTESFITASIIAKPPQIPLGSLVIDFGLQNDAAIGDLVLSSERIIIGKIVEVNRNQSVVSLNSSAGFVSYGYISRTDEPIEIQGNGGGFETKIPIDFDIKIGDKIMSNEPTDFLLAIVGAIEEDRSSGFKNVLLSLPTDLSKTHFVFVLNSD